MSLKSLLFSMYLGRLSHKNALFQVATTFASPNLEKFGGFEEFVFYWSRLKTTDLIGLKVQFSHQKQLRFQINMEF